MRLRYLRERKQAAGVTDARHLIRQEQDLMSLKSIRVRAGLPAACCSLHRTASPHTQDVAAPSLAMGTATTGVPAAQETAMECPTCGMAVQKSEARPWLALPCVNAWLTGGGCPGLQQDGVHGLRRLLLLQVRAEDPGLRPLQVRRLPAQHACS